MLTPLKRKKIEELCPLVPTGEQYSHYWGTPQDLLQRVAVSVLGVFGFWVLSFIFGSLMFFGSLVSCLYWLWGPIYWAAQRNRRFRKPRYGGFWQGEVLKVWGTEDVVGKKETVNDRGQLVITNERQRFLNLEIGDKEGFWTALKVPYKPEHRPISRRQTVCCLLISDDPDFERINRISDAYLPDLDLWVSDYPYLRRDVFPEIYRYLTVRSQPIIDLEME